MNDIENLENYLRIEPCKGLVNLSIKNKRIILD